MAPKTIKSLLDTESLFIETVFVFIGTAAEAKKKKIKKKNVESSA